MSLFWWVNIPTDIDLRELKFEDSQISFILNLKLFIYQVRMQIRGGTTFCSLRQSFLSHFRNDQYGFPNQIGTSTDEPQICSSSLLQNVLQSMTTILLFFIGGKKLGSSPNNHQYCVKEKDKYLLFQVDVQQKKLTPKLKHWQILIVN